MLGAMARAALRGLPWLTALAISASAAYEMAAAVAGAKTAAPRSETVTIAIDGPVSGAVCDATSAAMLLNAVSNGWIPARFAGYCRGE